MNYIYDILVNLNPIPYEFYEWNRNDEITHIRKIPLIKTSKQVLYDLLKKKVKVDKELLETIKNKAEVFTNRNIDFLTYASLFTDGDSSICIKFNNEGYNILKSKLQLEEEDEVIEVSEKLNITSFKYETISENSLEIFKTRMEVYVENYIRVSLNNLYNNNSCDKLKYIYYDCFYQKEDDKEKIIKALFKEINNNNLKVKNKIYDFFKLTSINK